MSLESAIARLCELLREPSTTFDELARLCRSECELVLGLPLPELLKHFQDSNPRPDLFYFLVDLQRQWATTNRCTDRARELLLVRLFGPWGFDLPWAGVQAGMDELAYRGWDLVEKGIVHEHAPVSLRKGGVPGSEAAAHQRLRAFSGGVLRHVSFDSVVLAGGSVLAILTGQSASAETGASDLDLFLYGSFSSEELEDKFTQVVNEITWGWAEEDLPIIRIPRETDGPLLVNGCRVRRHGFVISIDPPFGTAGRTVQVVFREDETVFDVLARFDLDACAVAYHATRGFMAAPWAIRSLSLGGWRTGVNFLNTRIVATRDPTGRQLGDRVVNYARRGFAFALPPFATLAAMRLGICPHCQVQALAQEARPGAILCGLHYLARHPGCDRERDMFTPDFYHDRSRPENEARPDWSPSARSESYIEFLTGVPFDRALQSVVAPCPASSIASSLAREPYP